MDAMPCDVSHPEKVMFPGYAGHAPITKQDLIDYYSAVAPGALRGVEHRPMILKRFVKGIAEEAIFQKRAPEKRPNFVDVAELRYARGTSAKEAVIHTIDGLIWAVNLGCVDLNPHPVKAADLDHPDELRVDLDPMPGIDWAQIIEVALVAREVLEDHGLTSWPKTSGSKGFHIYARITPNWTFTQVRRAAETVAREVERRAPALATSHWWKEDRHGVFVDFNQNAKDRTVASAYSVRATPDARVSTPLTWDEVSGCDPAHFTIRTVPARFAERGDPWAAMDDAPGSLDSLLRLAEDLGPAEKTAKGSKPLIEIARTRTRDEATAALDVWRNRYPDVANLLEPTDVLIDGMRGPSSLWYRIRINLEHIPAENRPNQEPLIADYSPWQRHLGRRDHGLKPPPPSRPGL